MVKYQFIIKYHFGKSFSLASRIIISKLSLMHRISDEFARNYIKTLVIPGAVERFMAEKDREQHNGNICFCRVLVYFIKFGCSNAKKKVKHMMVPMVCSQDKNDK